MNQRPAYPPPFVSSQQQQQVPFGYSPANASTFQPPQQASFTYPPSLPSQLQQAPPQRPQQQQQQPQFFAGLPPVAGNGQQQHQQQQQQQQQQPHRRPLGIHDAHSSVPSTPGNGPGAPPPQPDSPTSNYEETLMNALRRETTQSSQANVEDDEDDDNDDQMDEDHDDEPSYHLPPPPEAEYPNEEVLEKAMHDWSLEHGYELVRRASKKNARGLLYKRYFHCSKHGKVTSTKGSDKAKVRVNRKSNRIGCPMSLAAVSVDPHNPAGNWQIRHRKTYHNHPAVDAIQLAGHRRRARVGGVEKAVDGLLAIGTNTSDVLKFLQRTNPDGLFNRTDVANMKLKYKKYGTCSQRGDGKTAAELAALAASKTGFPSACMSCRAKKTKCDSIRPACGACVRGQIKCQYDHDPHPRAQRHQQNLEEPIRSITPNSGRNVQQRQPHASQNTHHDSTQQDMEDHSMLGDVPGTSNPTNAGRGSNHNAQHALHVQQALAALANFQPERVKPIKLSLESSSVEILANSTCGNGDSYKAVIPRPFALGLDWRIFKESFFTAAMKESTYDVLVGNKKEPVKPTGDVSIEDHNEYIKQLAIFKRRNDMLKIGIKESLHPSLWSRVNLNRNAHDLWAGLEDMCVPRGSDQAYTRFNDLHSCTLQSCGGNVEAYIHSLETKYHEYNQIPQHGDSRQSPPAPNLSNGERPNRGTVVAGSFPEELLCFTLLRNLGPQHQNLANSICKKNNIDGFGSGEKLSFKELVKLLKRHMDWDTRAGAGR